VTKIQQLVAKTRQSNEDITFQRGWDRAGDAHPVNGAILSSSKSRLYSQGRSSRSEDRFMEKWSQGIQRIGGSLLGQWLKSDT
jgi:hypothetical protein